MNIIDENVKVASSKHVDFGKKVVSIKNIKNKINKFLKRTLDIIAGIVGLIILIPLCVIIYIVNFLRKENGPMLFVQERIGKNGKLFKMYKFRSMVENAEEILEECINSSEETRAEYEKYKKLKDDPRITTVGKFLRKTSLDEFPQFINILKGEMSLVGPRPYLPREKEEMGRYYEYVINCKPGLTGLWQVAGRTNVNFKTRLRLDYKYYRESNFFYDLKILLNTFVITFTGKGAM